MSTSMDARSEHSPVLGPPPVTPGAAAPEVAPVRPPAAGASAAASPPAAPIPAAELERLRERLQEAEETLRAIRLGEVDALVVQCPDGPRTYTLVTADQSYRMLVEQISEAALTLSGDGIVLYSNGRLRNLLGLDNTISGQLLTELATAESRAQLGEMLGRARREPVAGEVMLRHADGRSVPFQLSLSPLVTGSFSGVCAIATDLTERKRREREEADERLTRAVLEFAGTGIAVCDAGGRVRRANRMAAVVFGDAVVDRTYDETFPTGPRFAEIIGPPLTDERREMEYLTPDGRRRYVVVSARPIGEAASPEEQRWVVLFSDITHRKEVEQERLRLLVAEHEARASAEAANQAKTQFLAVMSHELRTPLSAVIGYADLLAEGVGGPPNATQSLYIGRIKMSAWHLLSLIEGILSFARVEAGKETTNIQACDLAALAADVYSVIEGSGAQKGLSMRCRLADELAPAPTDPGKLRQILLNLLGNAIKFTDQGSVELVLERSGPYALFYIRDTGPGISAQDIHRIFEPFVQADQSATRKTGGTGLGLAIARNYADMIGAEVTVTSEVGAGSTFTVKVPLGD